MEIRLKDRQCITNAPVDYDYGWARTLIENLYTDDRGKVFRLVENEDDWHFKQQKMRYGSGMNITIDNQIQLEDWLRFGWLKPTEKPVMIHREIFDFNEAPDWENVKLDKLINEIDSVRKIIGVKLETFRGGLEYRLEFRGEQAEFDGIVNRIKACK